MKDIDLYERLCAQLRACAPPDPAAATWLTAELSALARWPMADRIAFLGPVSELLDQLARERSLAPDALAGLRAALLGALGGSTGFAAWQHLVSGLDGAPAEGEPDAVAETALRALATSALHDPARWIHALYHPSAALRALALEFPHPSGAAPMLLPMLADPHSAPHIQANALGAALESPALIPLVLALVARGHLDASLAAVRLAELDWTRQLDAILDALPRWADPAAAPPPEDDPEALWAAALDPHRGRDRLDMLLDLVWDDDAASASSLAVRRCHTGILGWLERSDVLEAQQRLALGAMRVAHGRGLRQPGARWPQAMLTLVLARFPVLVRDARIDAAQRRDAALALARHRGSLRLADPLARLAGEPLLRRADGLPDLALLGALLGLCDGKPLETLLAHFPHDEVVEAFRTEPIGSAALLALESRAEDERKRCLALMDDVFTPRPGAAWDLARCADALAQIAMVGRGNALRVLAQLHRFDGEMIVAVVPRVLALSAHTPLADRQGERVAEVLAAQIGRRLLPGVLAALASAAQSPPPPFVRELLCALGRACSTGAFVHGVETLSERDGEALVALLELIRDCGGFPYGKEQAVAIELRQHRDPRVQAWLERVRPAAADEAAAGEVALARPPVSGTRALDAHERANLASCPDALLGGLLRVCLEHPRQGLCAALRLRSSRRFVDVETTVALLVSDDPLDEVDALLAERYGDTTPAFLEAVDRAMIGRHQRRSPMPLHGNAWLYLWEAHLTGVIEQATALGGAGTSLGLTWLLERALTLRFAPLRARVASSVAKVLRRIRWRSPLRLPLVVMERLLELCATLVRLPTSEARFDDPALAGLDDTQRAALAGDLALGVAAADVLATAHEMDCFPGTMERERGALLTVLSELAPPICERLERWLSTRGMRSLYERFGTLQRGADADALAAVHACDDLDVLVAHCTGTQVTLAEEAALRLSELGTRGRCTLLDVIGDEPPCLAEIATVVAFFPDDDAEALAAAHALLGGGRGSAALRFHLALALVERGEPERGPAVLAALCEPSGGVLWLRASDWHRLGVLDLDTLELASTIVTSDQPPAYTRAVQSLLAAEPIERDALRAFLRSDSDRLDALRLEVAERLRAVGDDTGLPLLLAEAFGRKQTARFKSLLCGLRADRVVLATEAVLVAGPEHADADALMTMLLEAGVDPAARRVSLVRLSRDTRDRKARGRALEQLRDRMSRQRKLRRMAEVFAWGAELGRELTGRLFSIDLVGDKLGYTRLNEQRICVNPLPMLRGEQNGRAVVEALIAHELGHHVYHASDEGRALWARAAQEGLTGVFNLVLDEHLERNLRARREDVGNALKQLASYAFQHNEREIAVYTLVGHLGARAWEVLGGRRLGVARNVGCVRVAIGQIFSELEATGLSFSRFVRALRMGLGDRFDDPRVAEALELFRGKGFRSSSLDELYAIARRLRELFGDEIQILESVGQDGVFEADPDELEREAEGVSSSEIQQEVERIKDPKKRREGESSGRAAPSRKLWINVSEEHTFERITRVVPLRHELGAHRALAAQVARHSRRMRALFERLGLRYEPRGGRVRGRAVDRSRIEGLVVRGDPRVLMMREPQLRTDLFLGIVVDCSGSMASGPSMTKARLFATLLAEAAAGLPGIDVRVFGFTDTVIYDGGDANRCAAHAMEAGGGNNDAAGLWHAAQVAMASRRRARLLVMISDGLPTECSVAALRELVLNLGRRCRICCAQVAVRPLEEKCFEHYVEVLDENLDRSVREFGEIVGRLVWRTMRA